MTRMTLNGSPGSAIVGGAIVGSGRPAGAGRSGARPMVGCVGGALVTGSVISDWFTRD